MKNFLFAIAFINMILIMPLSDVNPLYTIIDIVIMVWCLLKFGCLVEKENKKGLTNNQARDIIKKNTREVNK